MTVRACTARGECVRTFIPSAAGQAQLGTSPRCPSTSTTQTRHDPVGFSCFRWQSVGMRIPSRSHASSTVSPALASIVRPFTSIVGIVQPPVRQLAVTAANLHTSTHVPHAMHLSNRT